MSEQREKRGGTARPLHVLVTGGAGFIGSHLVARLLERGDRVTAIDNLDAFYDAASKRRNVAPFLPERRFRLLEADLLDVDPEVIAPDGGFDVLVHLAARPGIPQSIREPARYARANVEGTAAALELARHLRIPRFVLSSSSSVYGAGARVPFREEDPLGRPTSPYAATKRAAELLCEAHHHLHGLATVCLRLFTVYGPRQRPDLAIHSFARRMIAGDPLPLYGGGSTERDYTYVDDVLGGIEGAIEHTIRKPGAFEIVNLGRGEPVSLHRLVELLSAALDVAPRVRLLPAREGDLPRTWADIRKARELFGYAPSVSIEEGIRRFAGWFRSAERG